MPESIIVNETKKVQFLRESALLKFENDEFPTIEDRDETKLGALNKLLLCMYKFYEELAAVKIIPQKNEYGKLQYLLSDKKYTNFDRFEISIESDWFDGGSYALHAGFSFHLYVNQDADRGRMEIADSINISIRHFNTRPVQFASYRDHCRVLQAWLRNKEDSYFYDIPMDYMTHVNLRDGFSFKTENFIKAVDDACIVMEKIMKRKKYLFVPKKII